MANIITINRQFGSGGREVGKRIADVLEIAYYDKELISKIAEETQFHPNYIEKYQESSITRHYPIVLSRSFSMQPLIPNDKIQITQTKIIKKLGESQSCVIVGRCANDILGEKAFKVFVYSSDMDARIQRCYDKVPSDKGITKEEMKKKIIATDKQRAKYHSYYTGQDWMNMCNYNLCIDTSKIDIKIAVEFIVKMFDK